MKELTYEELRDQWGAVATEAAMLIDMVDDKDAAIAALEQLETIVFYTHFDTGWTEVIGKRIPVMGFEFGIYHNGFAWVVDELTTGKSIGLVSDWRATQERAKSIISWKGPEWFAEQLQKDIQTQSDPMPRTPRIIPRDSL